MPDQNSPPTPTIWAPPNPMWSAPHVADGLRALETTVYSALAAIMTAGVRVGEWLDENHEAIDSFLTADGLRPDREWAYLHARISGATSLVIAYAAEAHRYDPCLFDRVDELLERELLDPGVIADVRAAVDRSELHQTYKRQLGRALDDLSEHDYELAVPMLVTALEGVYWWLAEHRGAVQRDGNGKWKTIRTGDGSVIRVSGIEAAVKQKEVRLAPELLDFITRHVYGGRGHPFRHGATVDGLRRQSLLLFGGLMGWLETVDELDARQVIKQGARRRYEMAIPPALDPTPWPRYGSPVATREQARHSSAKD